MNAFIFADLIVLPILDIYRKYYGLEMMWFIIASFYAVMTADALIIVRFSRSRLG